MHSLTLHVEPKTPPITREEFFARSPENSIALDGYVRGAPWYDLETGRGNFNHHEDVDRLSTRCTAAQVLIALRMGLSTPAHVYVNDPDEDVCTAVFLLRNAALVRSAVNPRVNRFVALVDALDSTAGSYPFPTDLPAMSELAWVFEPYRRFRESGGLAKRDAALFGAVIDDVGFRISSHLFGTGGSIALDTGYKRMGGGDGWVLAEELGACSKTGIAADGYTMFVLYRFVGTPTEPRYIYTIGRGPFARVNLHEVFMALNRNEKTDVADCWGGGSTIGGSPRVAGSKLPSHEVAAIFASHIVR